MEDKLCRICFESEEENSEELIAPCKCSGSAKWIHMSCLRRWQRMVLVSQPTHPSGWSDDERFEICGTCKGKFTCEPPVRHELMASFTGPEIAALIGIGKIICASTKFTNMLEQQSELAKMMGGYHNWIRGVYLITKIEKGASSVGDDGVSAVNLTRPTPSDGVPQMVRGEYKRVVGEVAKEYPCATQVRVQYFTAGPCQTGQISCCLVTGGKSGYTVLKTLKQALTLAAHNAANPQGGCVAGQPVRLHSLQNRADLNGKYAITATFNEKAGRWAVQLQDAVWVKIKPSNLEPISFEDIPSPTPTSDNPQHEGFHSRQPVKLHSLKGRADLNNMMGITHEFNTSSGRWSVQLPNSEFVALKPTNLAELSTPEALGLSAGGIRVMVFLGDAQWSRAQLLGEIANGSWGLCSADACELLVGPGDRWPLAEKRLLLAPDNEMRENYVGRRARAMDLENLVAMALAAGQFGGEGEEEDDQPAQQEEHPPEEVEVEGTEEG
eukprot:TRINITY_DN53110_c0_g1_i1.p1 TRINITY_DN53110_c0_g1~~TRINITY_DN53110_c0_g1_i1.p1  ORF type:complete len:496 (+),score=42.93 TRINITY_DN53110_c0_g1_i1:19-1506(+)